MCLVDVDGAPRAMYMKNVVVHVTPTGVSLAALANVSAMLCADRIEMTRAPLSACVFDCAGCLHLPLTPPGLAVPLCLMQQQRIYVRLFAGEPYIEFACVFSVSYETCGSVLPQHVLTAAEESADTEYPMTVHISGIRPTTASAACTWEFRRSKFVRAYKTV